MHFVSAIFKNGMGSNSSPGSLGSHDAAEIGPQQQAHESWPMKLNPSLPARVLATVGAAFVLMVVSFAPRRDGAAGGSPLVTMCCPAPAMAANYDSSVSALPKTTQPATTPIKKHTSPPFASLILEDGDNAQIGASNVLSKLRYKTAQASVGGVTRRPSMHGTVPYP